MATATADKKGMKRICPSCSTRYYDFNKRPVTCPNCKAEFTAEIKVRARRSRVSNDDAGQVSETTAAGKRKLGDDEDEDLIAEGEEGVVSLDELEDDEDDVSEEDEEGDPDLDLDEDDLDEDELDDEDLDEDEDEEEEDEDEEEDAAPKSRKKK
ncbi:MAG: FYDLN acid domain-containing protein [Micavibrio aeruginosavorus]|nr:FYDLN acid domain-containing protein [Micavibrio aeruginosavorus]